jgi:uncharacterized membrane protein
VAVLACAVAAVGAPVVVMIVLGIVLFAAPGYLLGQLLLGSHIAGLERLAVITGLAFCVPIVGGLVLSAAGVPLHRPAWLGLLAGVTLACDLALLVRHLLHRRSNAAVPLVRQRERRRLPAWHAVAFGAAVVVAGCAVGLASVGAARQHYPGFTQLWLLQETPNATTASLGVANHEGRRVRYELVLYSDNRIATAWNFDLSNGRAWQRTTQFTGFDTLTARLYRLPNVSSAYRYVTIDANRSRPTPSPTTRPHVRHTRRR